MANQFKPVRFFAMMRTAEERAAYAFGENPAAAKLPSDADLNIMAQKYFKQQGPVNSRAGDLAFENGYTDEFKKTHHQQ